MTTRPEGFDLWIKSCYEPVQPGTGGDGPPDSLGILCSYSPLANAGATGLSAHFGMATPMRKKIWSHRSVRPPFSWFMEVLSAVSHIHII